MILIKHFFQCSCLKGMSSDPRIQVKVFRCLGTWFSVDALPQEAVVQSGLLMAPFKALVSITDNTKQFDS